MSFSSSHLLDRDRSPLLIPHRRKKRQHPLPPRFVVESCRPPRAREDMTKNLVSIAGYDPSGGAGVLLDIGVFEQLGQRGFGVPAAGPGHQPGGGARGL